MLFEKEKQIHTYDIKTGRKQWWSKDFEDGCFHWSKGEKGQEHLFLQQKITMNFSEDRSMHIIQLNSNHVY
jgi:hypothetical protein